MHLNRYAMIFLAILCAFGSASTKADQIDEKLVWRDFKIGMEKPRSLKEAEKMGFHNWKKIGSDSAIDLILEASNPDESLRNCFPEKDRNCEKLALFFGSRPGDAKTNLEGLVYKIWLSHDVLYSKIVDPAIAKYGPPDKIELAEDRFGRNPRPKRWIYEWIPIPGDRATGIRISLLCFACSQEMGPVGSTSDVTIEVSDSRPRRARLIERQRKIQSEPPPIRY